MASSTSNISRKHLKPSPQRNRKCHMRTILVVEVSTHMGVVLWFVPKKKHWKFDLFYHHSYVSNGECLIFDECYNYI